MKTLCLDYLDSLFVSQNEKLGWSKKADYRRKNILSKFFKNEFKWISTKWMLKLWVFHRGEQSK